MQQHLNGLPTDLSIENEPPRVVAPESLKRDLPWLLGLALLLVAVNAPFLLRVVTASPLACFSQLARPTGPAVLPGAPTLEPCILQLHYALGHRAALDWLSGTIPWWNSYQGVGMPLAADMQSAALFLPFVLLLKYSWGQLVYFAALQWISGVCTYFLCRRLGASRLASFTGGALFELNGLFILMRTSILGSTAFFPMLLLAVEAARDRAVKNEGGGWIFIAVAQAMALYAGYPESVYIHGLLVAVWSIVRLCQLPRSTRNNFCQSLVLGVIGSFLLAAPLVVPFLLYLKLGYVSIHGAEVKWSLPAHVLPQLFFPFMYGPIWANLYMKVPDIWHPIGGYIGAVPVFFVLLGATGTKHRPLRLTLALWILCSFLKASEVQPITGLFDLLPLMKITLYSRYHYPTISIAESVLVCFALDDLRQRVVSNHLGITIAVCSLLLVVLAPLVDLDLLRTIRAEHALKHWPTLSLLGGALAVAVTILSLALMRNRSKAVAVCAVVLIAEASVLFTVPSLCRPRAVKVETGAVTFLRNNLGLQRFYTFGPIEPNLGGSFGIAQINSDDLPSPSNWVAYVNKKLLPLSRQKEAFIGISPAQGVTVEKALTQLQTGLANYTATGVKYVVVPAGLNSFLNNGGSAKLVFHDWLTDIYELPGPAPYYETGSQAARILSADRNSLTVESANPTEVVRRELFFPGWRAWINGNPAAVEQYGELFQAVKVPAGRNTVSFFYEPPFIGWCVWSACACIALMCLSSLTRRRAFKIGAF